MKIPNSFIGYLGVLRLIFSLFLLILKLSEDHVHLGLIQMPVLFFVIGSEIIVL